MGMVKALGYGSALVELPQVLAQLGLDWLGVAAPDEGVALREKGIAQPLLALLCSPQEARKIVEHRLTPAVHSFDLVAPLATAAQAQGEILDVHLKVDTGMRRLGVMPEQLPDLARQVTETGWLTVTGVMTHFGCAENPAQDDLTRAQLARFREAVAEVKGMGHTDIISHAAATGAAARFPESHFDMVRIGLGLYGLYPSPAVAQAPNLRLELAVSLVTRLLEVRTYSRGDRIGYGATYEVPRDGFRAGILPFGYHDGLPRCLSNRGFVLVNGQRAPLVGRVSMDSAVLDLSKIPEAQPGTEVLVYGKHGGHELRPEEVAAQADTISYELLTRIGPRVQRVFIG
jgi:alanine racemase/UDP-N-acetylmuramoyl-tripeptide--D-alanyl-D-alanine ligase